MNFRPMLCAKETVRDASTLKYPLLCSYKIDGLRAITTPHGPKTRTMKPLGNDYVHARLRELPSGLDGELVVMTDGKPDFRKTQSLIRRQYGRPDFMYCVFDLVGPGCFADRYSRLRDLAYPSWVQILPQVNITCPEELTKLYTNAQLAGYEGVVMKSPEGHYKNGRSTLREGYCMRMKPLETDEALVVNVLEEMENLNDAGSDKFGLMDRSSHKENMFGKNTMGALVVRSEKFKKSFKIGTGFTAEDRRWLWMQKPIGKIVHYSYDPTGGYDVPRQPVFKGFRDKADL